MDDGRLDREFLRFRDRGAPESLARVFDALAPRLLLIAGHLTRDAGEAEDLVQTTFLHAIRDARSYDGARPVAAWLAGILRHRARDRRRREALRRGVPLEAGAEPALALDPAELAGDAELYQRAVDAVFALEEPYRAVLALRVVHGLSPTAIAHALGRRPGTVRMQLKRGLEELRRAVPAPGLWLAFGDGGAGLEVARRAALEAAARHQPGPDPSSAVPSTTAGALPALTGVLTMKPLALVLALTALALALVWRTGDGRRAQPDALAGAARVETSPRATSPVVEGSGAPLERAPAPPSSGRVTPEQQPRLEVRLTFARDGSPAADVGLYLRAADSAALGLEARTDAQGRADLAPSAPGRYELHLDRLDAPVELRWPERRRLELAIPAGLRVEGRVVDLAGRGLPGASVLRRNARHHDVLQPVAIADEDGSFAVSEMADELELLARAPGYQPSELERVRGERGLARVELRLGADGHSMRGRVLLPDGAPAPFAWVLVGVDEDAREAPEGSQQDPQESAGFKPMDREGILLRADAEGRFASEEVPAGHALLVARSAGEGAPRVGWTTRWVSGPVAQELALRLRPGAELSGVVRDAAGAPLAGLAVEAEWEGTTELGQMEDELGPFVSDRRTITDEDGAFLLAGLLPGDHDLRVRGAEEELAMEERVLRDGERARWDPVVEPPGALDVRLLDGAGAPLAGWLVAADDRRGWELARSRAAETDDDGRARLRDLPTERDLVLAAFPPDARLPALVRRGVRAGRGAQPRALELRLDAREHPDASLSGRLVMSDGRPARGARLELRRAGWSGGWRANAGADGRFAFAGLAPGELRLRVELEALSELVPLGAFTLASGSEHDAGELVLPDPAPVVVRVRAVGGGELEALDALRLELVPGDPLRAGDAPLAAITSWRREGSELHALAPPGPALLRVRGEGLAAWCAPVQVRADGAQVDVTLARAAATSLRLLLPPDEGPGAGLLSVRVVVEDERGLRVHDRELLVGFAGDADASARVSVRLAPGDYRAIASPRGTDARRAEARLRVPDGGAEVVLDLR